MAVKSMETESVRKIFDFQTEPIKKSSLHWLILLFNKGNLILSLVQNSDKLLMWYNNMLYKKQHYNHIHREAFGSLTPTNAAIARPTFSAWASRDFKLLVTFFNSSSRSPDLLYSSKRCRKWRGKGEERDSTLRRQERQTFLLKRPQPRWNNQWTIHTPDRCSQTTVYRRISPCNVEYNEFWEVKTSYFNMFIQKQSFSKLFVT